MRSIVTKANAVLHTLLQAGYTTSLQMEAEKIQDLQATKHTRVYVFDETMSPSDVRSNLLDNSPHMGPYASWVKFTKETEAVESSGQPGEGDADLADPLQNMNNVQGRAGEGSAVLAGVQPAKRKVHASFSSGSAMTMLQISDAISRGGCESTIVHIAQTEMWDKVWGFKAKAAHTIVVVFDTHYKVNFIFESNCRNNFSIKH